MAIDSCLIPHSVAADVNCFGCRMFNTKLSGGVSGLLRIISPNLRQ